MADLNKPVAVAPTTRTYLGADCPFNHGGLRYRSTGGCVQCAKVSRYDRYQDTKMYRESARVQAAKSTAYRQHMDEAVKLLDAAGRELRAAKENAPRGMWRANLRSVGLMPRAVAQIRKWMEARERRDFEQKRKAAERAKENDGHSWME